MAGRHETPLPTVINHQVAHHMGDLISDWLVAEWSYPSQYSVSAQGQPNSPVLFIDTGARRGLDDADSPTELWCVEHTIELDPGHFEVDYV